MAETADALVLNPAHWCAHSAQLAGILAARRKPAMQISDPTGETVSPDLILAVYGAAHWGDHPAELADALRRWAGNDRPSVSSPGGAGAAAGGAERLTLTVEEAAAMLGISRAFAYEAVNRGEIPHIRIGRRILVPRSALERLLSAGSEPPRS
jgi:excisionase family DNA binding protein